MARTKDRHLVSEAVRVGRLWKLDEVRGPVVSLVTDFDEKMVIRYGQAGQILGAAYIHWNGETGAVVARENITTEKRRRVLTLIEEGHLA